MQKLEDKAWVSNSLVTSNMKNAKVVEMSPLLVHGCLQPDRFVF